MAENICPWCGQGIKDPAETMRAKSEHESLVNRIASQIIIDTGVDHVTACAQAISRIEKNRELFRVKLKQEVKIGDT